MSASAGSPFRAASTVQPSRSGIMMSSVIGGRAELARPGRALQATGGGDDGESLRYEKALHQVAHGRRRRRRRARRAPSPERWPRVGRVRASTGPRRARPLHRGGQADRERRAASGRRSRTVMSPPIRRQKRRLMASPRPVPPYLRVVEASACMKSWKSLAVCSAVMPMPVSATAHRDPVPVSLTAPRRSDRDQAALGELGGVAGEVEQGLAHARGIGAHGADVGGALEAEPVAVLLDAGGGPS